MACFLADQVASSLYISIYKSL